MKHKIYATWPMEWVEQVQFLQTLAATDPGGFAQYRRDTPGLKDLMALPLSKRGPITPAERESFEYPPGPEGQPAPWEVAFAKAAKKARTINKNLRPMLTADGPADEVAVTKSVGTFEAHVQSVDDFLFAAEGPQPQELLDERTREVVLDFKDFLGETVAKMREQKATHEAAVAEFESKIQKLEASQHVVNVTMPPITVNVPERATLVENHPATINITNQPEDRGDLEVTHPDSRVTRIRRRRL